MLVIARKVGQTLLIGDDVRITISGIRGDQVRLAIEAPRSVSIVRAEVIRALEQDNAAAVDQATGVMDLLTAAGAEAAGPAASPTPVVGRSSLRRAAPSGTPVVPEEEPPPTGE